jgi:hypothetical protein
MIFLLALTVTLMTIAASVSAQALTDEGTLIRLDPPSRVVMLEDGRMYRAVAGTSFLVGTQSETFDRLRPGARIVVIGGEPVVYRQGRYIALPALPPSLGLAVAPQPGGATTSSTVPAGYRVGPPPALPAPETSTLPLGNTVRGHVPASMVMPAAPGLSRTSSPPTAWRATGVVQPPSHLFPITHNAP